MAWTKLFADIIHSTIWQEDKDTRLVWITMLALADKNGVVGASVPGLASASKVELDACIAALEKLASPDLYSRTPDNEGRRIVKVEGGWKLLNHAKFREKGRNALRTDYFAERYRHQREKDDRRDASGVARLAVLKTKDDE